MNAFTFKLLLYFGMTVMFTLSAYLTVSAHEKSLNVSRWNPQIWASFKFRMRNLVFFFSLGYWGSNVLIKLMNL